jgi:hypothetical protein
VTTTGDVIALCDSVDTGYRPQGLPAGYSWYKGNQCSMNGGHPAPAGWTAGNAYWVVYPEDHAAEGKPTEPWVDCDMFVKDQIAYLHKKAGGWVSIQDAAFQQACARMDGPQTGNQGYSLPKSKQADGSWLWRVPPLGYCNHGWPEPRGEFAADQFDWCFATTKMKLSNPNADFLGMAGFDFWQSQSAPFPNNMGSGGCGWVKLKSDVWVELYATEMPIDKFEADPPPGVVKGAAGGGGTPVPPDPQPVPSAGIQILGPDGRPLTKGQSITIKVT